MTIKTKASVKADFQTSANPTEQNLIDLIDSTYTGEIGAALVSAVSAGNTGLIEVVDASSLTFRPSATAGLAVLSADTATSARAAISAQEDLITTQGDLIVGDAGGNASRLAIGTSGQAVEVSGSVLKYKAASGVSAATTAETQAETATDKYMSPERLFYHNSMSNAWGKVVYAAGTPSVRGSYNIDSITDEGAGKLLWIFPSATVASNYSILVTTEQGANAVGDYTTYVQFQGSATVRQIFVSGGFNYDPNFGFVSIVGSASAT